MIGEECVVAHVEHIGGRCTADKLVVVGKVGLIVDKLLGQLPVYIAGTLVLYAEALERAEVAVVAAYHHLELAAGVAVHHAVGHAEHDVGTAGHELGRNGHGVGYYRE